ncbi:MAG: protease modulator HflC, partial [Armatimonadetes bacterium]|nr:protease modulator HflC [Armatimonadota bacterium]
MKRNTLLMTAGLLVAALFVLLQVLFTVREGEAVVVTTFGKPQRPITEAGLKVRWPWPVQRLYRFDNRIHTLEGAFEETSTSDNKLILASVYAGWRIKEPIQFLERVGTIEQAERNLDGLLRSQKNAVLGQVPFSGLINTNAGAVQFEKIEQEILTSVQKDALTRYGVEIQFLGIRKVGLPESGTEAVFARMKAEREEIAGGYRSEGDREATKIRAEADSQRNQLLAQAEADAKRIRAEGDASAAESYQVFEKNPELAMFLRKLEVLEQTLKKKSTVVLSSETEPFDLLNGD